MKPSRLLLHDARSTCIYQLKKSDEFYGSAPFQMGNHNFVPIPIMLPSPWHMQYPQTVSNVSFPQPPAVVATSSHSAPCSSHPNLELLLESLEEYLHKMVSHTLLNCCTISSASKICRTGWRLMQGWLHLSWSMPRRMFIDSRKQEVHSTTPDAGRAIA